MRPRTTKRRAIATRDYQTRRTASNYVSLPVWPSEGPDMVPQRAKIDGYDLISDLDETELGNLPNLL